jgi:hypothetical protein
MNIETIPAKGKPKNALKGAIKVAIKAAELYSTSLVIKSRSGRIISVTPAQMKRKLRSE